MNTLYKITSLSSLVLLFIACQNKHKQESAQSVIKNSIAHYGYDKLEGKTIEFNFRGKDYSIYKEEGFFTYTRSYIENNQKAIDTLNNDGFKRSIDKETVNLEDTEKQANSLNSVVYFTQLPLGLNDPAVVLEKLPNVYLNNNTYHQLKITFKQEGGGTDYDDEFLYFIDSTNYRLAYFGYKYHTNGGGIRFRESINETMVDGYKFQDYINYKPSSINADFDNIFELYKNDKLIELSRIENKNIKIH